MPPLLPSPQTPAFTRVLDAFRSTLAPEDAEDFKYTKLEDLQRFIKDVQDKQGRKAQNLARLKPFLEGMEQHGKLVEVFLNASGLVAFVWGPTKFVLQAALNYAEAFDELLDVYSDIGESLPMLAQYESLFIESPYMGKVLELVYVDILDFHRNAYKYFKQRVWKQLFRATWKTFRSQFCLLIANLRRHKHLVETQASLTQFEEIQQIRLQAEIEFGNIRKAEELRRRSEVLEWLSPANAEEDQEIKAGVRSEYPGVCSWILDQKNIQNWRDSSNWNDSRSLLWIHGIPGAGKTTVASFLIEELRKVTSARTLFFYCKHEDNERNSFVALARALIAQAVRHDDILLSYVYEEAATCGERPLKTKKRAEDTLEMALKSLGQVYIVIDGLDECKVNEKSTISSWFKNVVNSECQYGSTHIRCLFLSQVDRETSKLLKLIPQFSIGHAGLARDIRVFCEIEGAKIKRKFGLPGAECAEIVERVTNEAQDMFLYAKLVMKNLFDQTRLSNLRRELEPSTFPKGIDKAYGRIVDRVLLCPELNQSEREDATQLLGLLVCAKRPLNWTEIQGAVSIDLGSRDLDIEERRFRVDSKYLCGSLVEIRPGGVVELVHMTAKQYLVNKSHLSLNEEGLRLSRLCLGYLSFHCFENGLPKHTIEEFVMTGHYIFVDYSIAYWDEHLLEVINSNDAEDLKSLHVVIESFLKNHVNPEAWETVAAIEKIMDRSEVAQYRQDLGKAVATLRENLDLEQVLRHIRSAVETLSASGETRGRLEILYGPNLFKCPRIDCSQFAEGFRGLDARDQHQKKHDRPFYCTFEGCLAAQTGFVNSLQLQQHISRIHDPFGVFQFPEPGDSTDDKIEQAIKSSDIVLLEQYLEENGSIKYLRYGSDFAQSSSQWWRAAMRQPDDKVINLLTRHTEFSTTPAQARLLELAIKENRLDLVRRFSRDEFRCETGELAAFTNKQLKHSLPVAVLKDDNVGALRVLLDGDLALQLLEKPRNLAIKAARYGGLACVQYLILEHGINPFQCDTPRTHTSEALGQGTSKETRTHSVLYNVVETGQTAICRFILSAVERQDISDTEDDDTLMELAARNGYERILEMLFERTDRANAPSTERYTSKAKLYNAMRYGRDEIIENLLYSELPGLDEPDGNGCSLLMYAALRGFLGAVEYLLANGADVNRRGNCPEITANSGRSQTALWMAVYNGHNLVVRRLLQCPNINLSGSLLFRRGVIQRSSRTAHVEIEEVAKSREFPAIVEMFQEHRKAIRN